MKRQIGWATLIGLLVLVNLIGRGSAQQPKPGGTLRVAWEADVTGLDPHFSPGIQAWYVEGNLFNSLLTIDAQLNYVPDLAESWDVLEDGKVYVFHLRHGVKFHDGTDCDAEAVRWNYQRLHRSAPARAAGLAGGEAVPRAQPEESFTPPLVAARCTGEAPTMGLRRN